MLPILSPEQLKEFGASVPQLVPWKRFGKAEEVAPVIAFLASKPASYVTVAEYTMGDEWKRESAAARGVDRTWDGRERTMKDTRRKERRAMTKHMTGTRKEWLAARLELLEAEKELTRRSDELAKRRQELPWVKIDKNYQFETDKGTASLADLFRGRSQLLIYHFMFGPDYKAGCPSCTSIADGFDGIATHLANHDVMLWAVSRAPLPKLLAYKERMDWDFPWASSFGTDFNADYSVGFSEAQQREGGIDYN